MLQRFTSDTDEKITASQIAKMHSFNQKSVSLFMKELEEQSILRSEIQGKNKLYSLNKENKEPVIQFLCALEHLRTLFFYQSHPNIKVILQKALPHIHGIAAVFGSYAKGTQKDSSDIDLYIAGKYGQDRILEISNTYSSEINIKHQKSFREDTLTREVKKNHIVLKNTEQFIREANQWIS